MLTDRYDDALSFASRLHREQTRKGTTIPYIAHLIAVSGLVLEHGGDEDAAIGGLLQDAAEDQGGEATLAVVEARYGPAVARIVADCTDSWVEPMPPWRARKEAYIESLEHKAPDSLLVSLADKTHNARAIMADYRVIGEALWSRFTGSRNGTLWYYRSLSAAFDRLRPGALADEIRLVVAELGVLTDSW